jgi:hypothetical protein
LFLLSQEICSAQQPDFEVAGSTASGAEAALASLTAARLADSWTLRFSWFHSSLHFGLSVLIATPALITQYPAPKCGSRQW